MNRLTPRSTYGGFTLIELLIVVAIIGILAAIAVPNFLNARMRAMVAKMESDMKALADALTMYQIDNKCFPIWYGSNPHQELGPLTTPVSYIAAVPEDPFRETTNTKYSSITRNYDYHSYGPDECKTDWLLIALGPDKDIDTDVSWLGPTTYDKFKDLLYNPSNGIVSRGDALHTSWFGLSF
ncbi:MAG: prepilin-type N-terminal cleavage/methylation domain-containing protein [bacterium]